MSNSELVISDERLNEAGRHVYITAPRDNPVHTGAVGTIAEALSAKKIPIHVAKPPVGKKWRDIAADNRVALIDALFVIAMLDWPQADANKRLMTGWPTHTRLHHNFRVGREVENRTGAAALIESEVNFTDGAVARDIGFADACGLVVVGYVHSAGPSFTVPRSLAAALDGWLRGPRKLADFVKGFDGFDKSNSLPWDKLTQAKTK